MSRTRRQLDAELRCAAREVSPTQRCWGSASQQQSQAKAAYFIGDPGEDQMEDEALMAGLQGALRRTAPGADRGSLTEAFERNARARVVTPSTPISSRTRSKVAASADSPFVGDTGPKMSPPTPPRLGRT